MDDFLLSKPSTPHILTLKYLSYYCATVFRFYVFDDLEYYIIYAGSESLCGWTVQHPPKLSHDPSFLVIRVSPNETPKSQRPQDGQHPQVSSALVFHIRDRHLYLQNSTNL